MLASCVLLMTTAALNATPIISEFMAKNDSILQDEDGDFSDWVEIYNPDETPLNLEGWHLTDDESDLTQWTFPDVAIPPKGFLLVYCSNKDRRDPSFPLHTNFALSTSGEYLGLIEPDGETIVDEFAPTFPKQQADISYGIAFEQESVRLIIEDGFVRWMVP